MDNPILTRASSSFVSAENIYEQENNENADNEYIGFLIPDEKYRNFFNKDLEIIINDTLYKATKYGTLFTHISNKSELIKSLENISEFKPLSNNTKQYGNIKLSRAKGKKSPVLASLVRYFLPFALDKYSVRSYLCAGK